MSEECSSIEMQHQATQYIQKNRVENLRLLFSKTNNPLYVWQAIFQCHSYEYPLPKWCLDYIVVASAEIQKIIVKAASWTYTNKQAQVFSAEISPKKAAACIPQALGIVDGTRNAFDRMAKDREKMNDAQEYVFAESMNGMTDPPFTTAEVEEGIRTRRNLDSKRSARARIKVGKTLLSTPHG